MKPALVSVFALAIILSSCSSSLPAVAPTGTPATPDATKTATPTRTPSPAPTETPTPTPEYPTSCFDQAVIDQVVADFPAKDRGPNGDGVGAGRTVEQASHDVSNEPYIFNDKHASWNVPFYGNEARAAYASVQGPFIGHTRISMKDGNVGLCGIVRDPDGIYWPSLLAVDVNGKIILPYLFGVENPSDNTFTTYKPQSLNALEDWLNIRIGKPATVHPVLYWKNSSRIGRSGDYIFDSDVLDLFGPRAYFREATVLQETEGMPRGMTLAQFMDRFIDGDDDPALLTEVFGFYEKK
jgi:hypothetical protein